jgi:hypothetical protein
VCLLCYCVLDIRRRLGRVGIGISFRHLSISMESEHKQVGCQRKVRRGGSFRFVIPSIACESVHKFVGSRGISVIQPVEHNNLTLRAGVQNVKNLSPS